MSSVSVNNTFVTPAGNKSAGVTSITGANCFASVASSNKLIDSDNQPSSAASGSKTKFTLPKVKSRSASPAASSSKDGYVLVGNKNTSSSPPSDGVVTIKKPTIFRRGIGSDAQVAPRFVVPSSVRANPDLGSLRVKNAKEFIKKEDKIWVDAQKLQAEKFLWRKE